MKQQLYNLFYTSPLEQFENNAIVLKQYEPIAPEVYLNWVFNSEYSKMIDNSASYFFDVNTFSYFQDKIEFIFCIGIIFLILGAILNNFK